MAPGCKRRKKQGSAQAARTIPLNECHAKQLALPPPFAHNDQDTDAIDEPLRVLTIGHSNHDPRVFLDLLRQHGPQTLVDVRSAPYSRYAPHFNRGSLDALLNDASIRYIWAGDTLGGRPDDPACYRDGVVALGNIDAAC